MAPSPKKPDPKAYPCEVSLQSSLKNCLVNLPAALASVLINANTAAQNVIVELTCRQTNTQTPSGKQDGKQDGKPIQRSFYFGWTGMQSKRKMAPLIGQGGLNSQSRSTLGKEHEISVVEIDLTFGKLLGLVDGQQVGILLRPDPPQAHTVNIEPLTATDWEIIELHANFLEINLLSQIRALPNPAFKSGGTQSAHPLTLHLSPTSTASIIVTSLTPSPLSSIPFVKISPDAEVIVTPKTRASASSSIGKDSKSVQSIDVKSSASTTKTRGRRAEGSGQHPVFLRGVDRNLAQQWFDEEEELDRNEGLRVWVDWGVLNCKDMRGVSWVILSIVRPSGFQAPSDPSKSVEGQEEVKAATCIVAQVFPWEDAPDNRHIAMSSQLCSMLDSTHILGETVRMEAAPPQAAKVAVRSLKIYPFSNTSVGLKDGFRFGGKSKADREESARRLITMYGNASGGNGLFEGPLTDGMVLPGSTCSAKDDWEGGILKFDPPTGSFMDLGKSARGWLLGSERRLAVKLAVSTPGQAPSSKLTVEVMGETAKPASAFSTWSVGEPLPAQMPILVGIDPLITQLISHIRHGSSLLLTGGRGSGKTAICRLLGNHFREILFHITYFPCRILVTEETRMSTIKETVHRIFGLAAWSARNGGHALVILEDLDVLCPVETELQVGGDNGRSRHISEMVISMARQYCSSGSGVILLATAKAKEEVNNVIIAGHVVREIVAIQAPDKETRRRVLEEMVKKPQIESNGVASASAGCEKNGVNLSPNLENPHGKLTESESHSEDGWQSRSPTTNTSGFVVDAEIDFLELAGQTDGYMPGDLRLLVSRARSEALIRRVTDIRSPSGIVQLTTVDFTAALKGFTPSSLRNVTLQHSTTTFSSIGGLRETRQILLETLQYPTLYAPIFARCPLRLRSGLLLYGYPGCGKTLLASAVAGECGLNFISVKGPEILNKYIGASEKSVRDLFERAQAARPCVLFFDEFDSVAPKRGHDSTGVTDRVVNQLLTQMDGAEGLSGVYVLAATSRPDLIDPALLRPGRLDKSLLCDMPDHEDRLDILRALSKKLKLDLRIVGTDQEGNGHHTRGQSLDEVARRTEGYSGADLQAVVYNAHLEAIHDVLGDRNTTPSRPGKEADKTLGSDKSTIPDFTYFRFDADADDEAPLTLAGKASERARIAAQIASHRLTQQRARRLLRAEGSEDNEDRDGDNEGSNKVDREPVIEWQHIERSLAQTRASISREERRRLTAIYSEFVVGRNGEMPSGQGGSEIGGRSSLM